MMTPLERAAACPEYQALKAQYQALRESAPFSEEAMALRDKCNAAFQAIQDRWQAEKDAEESAKRERTHGRLDRYLATLPAMAAGKQRKSLEKLVRSSEGIISRHALIESKIAKGWRVSGDFLESPCGEYFLGAAGITTFGLAYARWLQP